MKAIILAAGYGNRMRPLTDRTHKTLIEVEGRTIIGRIIEALAECGVRDVVVVTGYKEAELRTALTSSYPAIRFTFVHNARYRETNNIFSMALALESISIDSDIILIESDLVFTADIIRDLLASPYPNVALVDRFRSGMDGTVVTVKDDVITSVIPPHLQPSDFDFSDKYKTLNIYKFSREFCESSFRKLLTYYARVINDNCYYELILGILIYMQQETIHAVDVHGRLWAEVDDPNDLAQVRYLFSPKRRAVLEEAFGGYWSYDITDFCFIRNMYFPTGAVISEIKNALPSLLYNYGSRQGVVNRKMSWFLLCDEEKVRALNGASQLYPLIGRLYADRSVLIPMPTFGEYSRVLPRADTYADSPNGFDLDAVARKAQGRDLVVVVNPNNPTGSVTPSERLYAAAAATPSCVWLVDESFIEFSPYHSLLELLERAPLENVLVLKSLSKSLGMPGVRLGFAYTANAKLRAAIDESLPIWGINSTAEFVLEVVLKHRRVLAQSFTQTMRDKTAFAEALRRVPAVSGVYGQGGNYLLVELKADAPAPQEIVDYLLVKHGIYVKNVSGKFGPDARFLRLAVRLPEENEKLVSTMKAL